MASGSGNINESPRNIASFTLGISSDNPTPVPPTPDADEENQSSEFPAAAGLRHRGSVSPEPVEKSEQAWESLEIKAMRESMDKTEIKDQMMKKELLDEHNLSSLNEVKVDPPEEDQTYEKTVHFAWSAGWALFFSGCFLFVPLVFAALLPNMSNKYCTYNNMLPAWFSRGILLYLSCVLAVIVIYRKTCKRCGMPQLSWIDNIEDRVL